MERRRFIRSAGVLATGGLSTLAGCSGGGDGGDGGDGGGATTTASSGSGSNGGGGGGGGTTIDMVTAGSDFYFDPIGLFVEPGTTVAWRATVGSHSSTAYEKGNGPASVTRIPDGATAWNSDILASGSGKFEHTFETQGTYDYFCIPHKSLGMVGRVVVGEPGGPAEGSMPPDGDVPDSSTIVDQGSVSYDAFKN